MNEAPDLKRGDWLECKLPGLTSIYGRFCQVEEVPRPDLGQGVRVAFPPTREGWKPYRTALDNGNWVRADDAVTLLGWITERCDHRKPPRSKA